MKDKYTLNLLIDCESRADDISFWIDSIKRNQKLRSIIQSKAFQRLKHISFLGAIDYSENNNLSKENRSRATHSLYVAALANYISTCRGYNEDLKNNLIAAALIHDIGHMPLSHSAEPYIKSKLGYGHHEIGEQIIDGEGNIGLELNRILRNNFDSVFIKSLLNNKMSENGGDLFSSQINIDTIDGIIRSLEYKGKNKTNRLNRLEIAKSAFLTTACEEEKYRNLDHFWQSKHFVYHHFINKDYAFISDKVSQLFFMEEKSICEQDLFLKEDDWEKKYSTLFSWLKDLKHNSIPECMKEYDLEMVSRTYYIMDNELDLNKRYRNTKNIKTVDINKFLDNNYYIQLKIQEF
ncbi:MULTISPECIES: HD domain-containing protein [unclassified Brenneria]|uniref:HD domain-containing protein n=1 Tax=unclassified Brenneria TaxID=2634434 RepID=UPI0029C543C8|nr:MULTISPECIES: HD domain-containing protein [unclassified Brenneria]MDX5627206.1 HD domain-containing protein [Brenneria sp. L3-3Z]MDX5694638.1 HD domain-containing protein [Brenneria sp. L4-2C]